MEIKKTTLTLALIAGGASQAHADTLSDMLSQGKMDFQLRPRYESVQQNGNPNDASAFTMRTMLGYSLAPKSGIGGMVQFINVSNLGSNHFNSTKNGMAAYPVVADPSAAEVNQAYLDYSGLSATLLKFGRQVIILDNARFVGNVDFRQNMQTFDGFSVENKSIPKTELFAAHISHTKGSYANGQVPAGYNLQSVGIDLLHASFVPMKGMHLSAYDYFYKDRSQLDLAAGNISDATTGIRLNGSAGGKIRVLYTAEYAKQRGYAGGKTGIDAKYRLIGGGIKIGSLLARLDYEDLGANSTGTYGLQTPLATKHAFNGWADMFLVTPGKGLKDMYATLSGKTGKFKLAAIYHDYKADYDSTHYGSEGDLTASYPVDKHLGVSLIYADYRAKDGAGANYSGTTAPNVNTRKTWLTLNYLY